jgi:hypothetical protein
MKVDQAFVRFDDIFVTTDAIQVIIKRHNLETDEFGNWNITPAMIDEARAIDDAARARGEKLPTQSELKNIDWQKKDFE